MIGTFKDFETCRNELINQGFKFSHFGDDGNKWFTNESKMDIAEIHIYKDGSVSAFIGKYTKKPVSLFNTCNMANYLSGASC